VSRGLCACVAATGFLSATFTVALASHTSIGLAQSAGLLGGDYGSHPHPVLFPLGLAAVTALLSAIFLYVVHLASTDLRSLPSLARAYRARLAWRSVALTAFGAALVLVAMETAEQVAVGRFDGLFSAFGSSPGIGLALVLLLSAAGIALLRALCEWLAGAHARIVLAIAYLLRRQDTRALLAFERSKCALRAAVRNVCDAPQALGKRAPPILAR
jgi:hypothetical protein